ncbi:hypothetical protein EDB86DRAFT_2828657 [Lactarius hatsudake]|nr:hypothetical protein EDB86DRAFT_2828657 [Lactarius hatsudake]
MEVVLVQEARCRRHFRHVTAVVALAAVVSRLRVVTAAASPSPSVIAVVLRVTVAATLRVTVTVALHFTATVALRDVVVIDLVAVVVGVVAADCTLCGVALWRLLRAVGGGSGGGLVRGDELEAAATGLCAARWRRRWRWGLEGSPSIALGGVGAKGRGVVAWWIACPPWCCPWSRGGGPRAKAIPGREPLEE